MKLFCLDTAGGMLMTGVLKPSLATWILGRWEVGVLSGTVTVGVVRVPEDIMPVDTDGWYTSGNMNGVS